MRLVLGLACGLWVAGRGFCIEVATGQMLGPGYDRRAFYVRANPRAAWQKTYSGEAFRPEMAGRLMNLRVAQALFEDEWLTEFPFDPEENTDRVIAALDVYKAHGILAINVSMQGGNPGYGKEVPQILRIPAFGPGPGKGALISAFRPDGSLKPPWLGRLERLQRALDQRGMILDLMYFYQGQDEVLTGPEAIRRAVIELTDWLIEHNARNVIIEIANEYDVKGWNHGRWIPEHIGELIELARSRFRARGVSWRLPISASSYEIIRVDEQVRQHADLTMIHGNDRTPEEKRRQVAQLYADPTMPGPILMNEDNNGRDTTPEVLQRELASCDAVLEAGGSWGYMPWRQVQMFPFRHYLPAGSSDLRAGLPLEQSDPIYFKAVLEHIRRRVYR